MPEYPTGVEHVCHHCDKPYRPGRRARRFCSLACFRLDRKRPLTDRFWEKVDRSGVCWLWTAHIHRTGYGYFQATKSLAVLAHRMAWILTHGPIADDLCVLHDCPGGDNRACVNPAHLWLGTVGDNNADKAKKGRASSQPGRLNRNAKLTESQVLSMRERFANGTATRADLAVEHGVTRDLINRILSRRAWKHV